MLLAEMGSEVFDQLWPRKCALCAFMCIPHLSLHVRVSPSCVNVPVHKHKFMCPFSVQWVSQSENLSFPELIGLF